jgi:stage II sporulation protein B
VDKPTKGNNTIKIKLNGESQNFKEEPIKSQKESTNDSFSTVIKINKDFNEQDGFRETAAGQESMEESFDWIIPESAESDIEEYKIVSSSQKPKKTGTKKSLSFLTFSKKRNGSFIKSIVTTAVFAVLIGTSFGVFMLNLFVEDKSNPTVAPPVVEETETGTDKGGEKAPAGTASAVIPAQTAFVVQGGVFSSKDAAKEGASLVTGKGAPAQSIEMSGKEYLFLGVADSVETAKELGSHFKANGIEEVFAKQLPIGEKTVSDINETEKGFLEAAPAVFQELSKITSSAILSSSISAETIKTVSGLEDQINQDEAKLTNEKVRSMNVDLKNAVTKIKAFQSSKDSKSLIEAQQHLLTFLTVYYSL